MEQGGAERRKRRMGKEKRARRRWVIGKGVIGRGSSGNQWPEHCTHPSRFDGRAVFLTLGAQRTGATMANTGGIEHQHRAIPVRETLLRVERVISRTTQRSIWLQSEIGSSKSFGEGSACPLRRLIADRLIHFGRLTRLRWLINLRRGEFRHTHARSRQMLPEL